MPVSEPLTSLTDYLLGAASLYFALSLLRTGPPKRIAVRLWALGFFTSAAGAFIGGTFHALKLQLPDDVLRSLWNVTIFLIGASGAFMISGVLTSSIRRVDRSRTWLLRGVWATLAGFAIQQSGIPFHNDIFHCTQILALYLFFRAAQLLEDHFSPR
jgi:hypothetical protein